MNWEPTRFTVGDEVVDPERPKWGVGRVVDDRTFPRSATVGQRLLNEGSERGLVTVCTAKRVLERVTGPTGGPE